MEAPAVIVSDETAVVKLTNEGDLQGEIMSKEDSTTLTADIPHRSAFTTQKLVLDEETLSDLFLKCSLCNDRYNMSDKSPRILPCHHSFCLDCLVNFFKAETENQSANGQSLGVASFGAALPVTCPNCCTTFLTSEAGLSHLDNDQRVIQLMELLGPTDIHDVTYCSKHPTQYLSFFCERCDESVCRICTVYDHNTCVAKQNVLDINEAKEKYILAVENGIDGMKAEMKSLGDKQDDCKNELVKSIEGDQELIDQIKHSFKNMKDALDARENALLEEIKSQTGGGEEKVEENLKLINKKEQKAVELLDSLKTVEDINDIGNLYENFEKLQNYQNEPAVDTETSETDKVKPKYIHRGEGTLIYAVHSFGEIQDVDEEQAI